MIADASVTYGVRVPDTANTLAAERRTVLKLAFSALGVLAAEPLYLLVDTAVIGHVGKVALAGLAVGAVVLAQVSTQLTFLSYGTTASAARLFGAGRRRDAVVEGVQATYLAIVVGVLLLGIGELVSGPVARLIAGPRTCRCRGALRTVSRCAPSAPSSPPRSSASWP